MSHHELQLQRSICPITLGQRLARHTQIGAQSGHRPFDSLAKLLKSPNRRRSAQELDRAAALARRKRPRRALIRDVVFALTIALILFGAWKAIAIALALGTP
jgi:hypothetical protein